MNLHFGPWADDCHNSLEQIKRLSAAQKIPAAKITVNTEKQTAVIAGSGSSPYQVSLDCSAEIEKYYHLMEQGILTQEEFQAKKNQLLGL